MVCGIVVTYNGMAWLPKCLKSLLASSTPLDIIVIDNGSSDETQNYIRTNFPEVELIEAKENLGFGVSNNIGVKRAIEKNAQYVLLLNQDVYIQQDTVQKLLFFFRKESDIALISPIHLNGMGNAVDIGFQSCLTENLCSGFISDAALKRIKPYYFIHSVNAATWLLDVKVIKKIGLFSPAFYHYGEDINFQQRLKYFGYKAIIVTNAFIHHDRDNRNGEKSETGKVHEIKTNQMTLLLNINESFKLTLQRTIKYSGLLVFEKKYKDAVCIFWDTIIKKNIYKSWREELKKGIPL